MNLALHGFLLQVILSILNLKYGFKLCSAGEPGYLDFDNLPETNFSCQGKVIGGYYADVEAGCQMFHVCTIGQKDEIMDIKFLCLNGTVFDQETRVCERVDEVDCSKSERFYNLNLELYGNSAVTLSLLEEEDDDSTEPREDREQQPQLHITSARPSTTTSTSTTTLRPSQLTTNLANNVYQQQQQQQQYQQQQQQQQHSTGYPQHYQPQPAFPSIQTSQSNSHYNDKNGGYHHQYIFHNDQRSNNNQATSYQLFSNQGASSTTPTSQVHQQVRYSSTASPQVVHNDQPSTVTPLQFHVQSTSTTIETLLNNNINTPSLINPPFHNHGIASTTEQFDPHNNNPREITKYQDSLNEERDIQTERRPLEPIQSTSKGKISKLTISPVPQQDNRPTIIQTKSGSNSQRISVNYLPTPSSIDTTISSFYPTLRTATQKSSNQQNVQPMPQHIHVPPPPSIPQLKPHQITINLPPPDIQRIVQNPSPLLPSQSRVIVTAKASVSDESGRPLNASQLITLPLPTIPSNYDDYKEGDESFDPFYRDVPKIRNDRRIIDRTRLESHERSLRKKRSLDYDGETSDYSYPSGEVIFNAEIKDLKDLKANLPIIKAILFGLNTPERSSGTSGNKEIDNIGTHNVTNNVKDFRVDETYDDSSRDTQKTSKNAKISVATEIKNTHAKPQQTSSYFSNVNKQQSPSGFKNQMAVDPIIVEQINVAKNDTVYLFLHPNTSQNVSVSTGNTSKQTEFVNRLTDARDANRTDKLKQEMLQPHSSPNSNKSNRRRYQNNESTEEYDEYRPRRNEKINKPNPLRYIDDYNADERVELGSRQRSSRVRQRLKHRRIPGRRDYYVNDEIQDDREYNEDENNKKPLSRNDSQGHRNTHRNRNRYYHYEDSFEDESSRERKAPGTTSNKSRLRPHSNDYTETRQSKLDSLRRKTNVRQPVTIMGKVSLQSWKKNANRNGSETQNLRALKDVNLRMEDDTRKNVKYSLNNEENVQHPVSTKKRFNSLERDEDSIEDRIGHNEEDYLENEKPFINEYNESDEIDDSYDYTEYPYRPQEKIKSEVSANRKNKNRFDVDTNLPSQQKFHRREKSQKFEEKSKNQRDLITENVEYEDVEATYASDGLDSSTMIPTIESTILDGIVVSYEQDNSRVPVTGDSDITDLPDITETAVENISTEGIFKFTDELPEARKKEQSVQENKNEEDKLSVYDEDYVDDNYEPVSYTDSNIKDISLSTESNNDSSTNKPILIISETEGPTTPTVTIDAESTKSSDLVTVNKEEYDDIYEDKSESTPTSSISPEVYDEMETTTNIVLVSTTSTPISTSTVVSASSSTIKTTSTEIPASPKLISRTTTTMNATVATSSPILTTTMNSRMKTTSKLFKPIVFRKTYAYIPPSTTPNTVVIRRGQPLTGPKPTKPPPSYNELAPKPVIRRLPLLSRTTTTTSEASIVEVELPLDPSNNPSKVNEEESIVQSSTETNTEYPLLYLTKLQIDNTTTDKSSWTNDTKMVATQSTNLEESNDVPESLRESNAVGKTKDTETESTTINRNQSRNKLDESIKELVSDDRTLTVTTSTTTTQGTTKGSERRKLELMSVKTQSQKTNVSLKKTAGFNCLEKEMYRFYGDVRDCRLFHYCSPGFTTRQVLDFRFVCEEGTVFDEDSQSCKHDVPNLKCIIKTW